AAVLEGAGPRHDVEGERRRERAGLVADRLAYVAGTRPERRVAGDLGELVVQRVHADLTVAGDRLVGGADQLTEAVLAVQRGERHDHGERGAVRVGDDALRTVAYLLRVDLGHDQRHIGVHPERAGVVDRDHATGGRDGRPLGRDLIGNVEHRDVHTVERLGRE